MSLELLDKTRRINQLLSEQETDKVDFMDFCRVLALALYSNILLVSRKGKILGLKERKDVSMIQELHEASYGIYIDTELQERFLNILSTKENANLMTLGFSMEESSDKHAMVVPVNMAGRRLGTLLIYRENSSYTIDDIILAEYGAMVIALAMQRAESEEVSEEQHKERDVNAALHTLSRSEAEAMAVVLNELDGATEGMLITSRLADKVGITRSVIVNALRKCESAGVIQTKSLGMKGTQVRIVNDLFAYEYLSRYIHNR